MLSSASSNAPTPNAYMQKVTNIPGSNSVNTDQVEEDKISNCLDFRNRHPDRFSAQRFCLTDVDNMTRK